MASVQQWASGGSAEQAARAQAKREKTELVVRIVMGASSAATPRLSPVQADREAASDRDLERTTVSEFRT
jgi:hypothetical protein